MSPDKSPEIKEDPTQSRGLIQDYEDDLIGLMKDYHKQVRDLFKKKSSKVGDIPNINLEGMGEDLSKIMDGLLTGKGKKVTEDASIIAYRKGKLFANINLGEKRVTLVPADWRVIDVLKSRNLMALKDIYESSNTTIIKGVTEGMTRGEGYYEIAQRIEHVLIGEGDEQTSLGWNRAIKMARTETMFAVNNATKIRYSQVGINKVRWESALIEGRTCDYCEEQHGEVYDIEDAPEMPAHPLCLCTWLPVFEEES